MRLCGADTPSGLDIVTETLPSALMSPLNVKGTVKWKLLPLCRPVVPENQPGPTPVSETVSDVPVSCAPGAGWNVNVALVRSLEVA